MTATLTQSLTGQYTTNIQNLDCSLELHLDGAGCLVGEFVADGERLEIMGGVPNAYGEVFGLILEPEGILAVFRAAPQAQDLIFEVDVPGQDDLMQLHNAERLMFRRREAQ